MKTILICAAIAITCFIQNARANTVYPKVLLETNQGEIVLELYPEKAPETVENFLKYVRDGFYNGTIFHRVIKGFMIQGGGMTEGMSKKTTLDPVKNEAYNGLKNLRGTVAMARTMDRTLPLHSFSLIRWIMVFLILRAKLQQGGDIVSLEK